MPLFLLPNLLAQGVDHTLFLPQSVTAVVPTLQGLFAESEKGGRLFLSLFMTKEEAFKIPIALIKRNTPFKDFDFFLMPVRKERWGFISDAGLPCVADPGSAFVHRAREIGISVTAYPGPSSILMALMLSGLPAQRFAFHGYISRENQEQELKKWELASKREDATQIFIETPYRNTSTAEYCVKTLQPDTYLSISSDLTLPSEQTLTYSIKEWRKREKPDLAKRPAVFLICAS